METVQQNKKIIWAGRGITAIAAFPFLMSAAMKFKGGPEVIEGMSQMGLPENILVPIGVLELLCVVIYLVPMTSVLGAILLAGYLGGAILTHLRVGQAVPIQVTLGILVWLGIYLREPRLHSLLPLRKNGK